MYGLAWKAETGWIWTGESSKNKNIWTEIRRNGEGAGVKDYATVVFENYHEISSVFIKILINFYLAF